MFSSPYENEHTTLSTKNLLSFVCLVCREEFVSRYESEVMSFNSFWTNKTTTLYFFIFPSFECKLFLKDLKSTLPLSVALWLRSLANNPGTKLIFPLQLLEFWDTSVDSAYKISRSQNLLLPRVARWSALVSDQVRLGKVSPLSEFFSISFYKTGHNSKTNHSISIL